MRVANRSRMRASANVVLDVIRAELSRGSLDRNHAGAPAYGVTRIKEIKQDGHDRDGEHPTKGRVGFALSDLGTRGAITGDPWPPCRARPRRRVAETPGGAVDTMRSPTRPYRAWSFSRRLWSLRLSRKPAPKPA